MSKLSWMSVIVWSFSTSEIIIDLFNYNPDLQSRIIRLLDSSIRKWINSITWKLKELINKTLVTHNNKHRRVKDQNKAKQIRMSNIEFSLDYSIHIILQR